MLDNDFVVVRWPNRARPRVSSFPQVNRSWQREEKWFCNAGFWYGKVAYHYVVWAQEQDIPAEAYVRTFSRTDR